MDYFRGRTWEVCRVAICRPFIVDEGHQCIPCEYPVENVFYLHWSFDGEDSNVSFRDFHGVYTPFPV